MKSSKVSITGLGYVGLQVALAFSKKHETIGFDIDKTRIKELKKNFDKTNEVEEKQLLNSKLLFTHNIQDLKKYNFHIIAVPTPINRENTPDLRILKKASQNIGKIIKKNDTIIYESTVYPGLTEEICIPILEKFSGLKNIIDFQVGYSPERINPGDKKNNFMKINKIVSAQTTKSLNVIYKLYSSVTNGKIIKVKTIKEAEAAKVIENTQRDINVALINEFCMIFNKLNIDTKNVLNAASSKWNFLNFEPGLVGGHCIGVDPYYLTYKSKQVGINPKLILAGRKINDQMPKYIVTKILSAFVKTKKLNINIMGLTFKENCADIRNSKVLEIIKLLISKGHNINLYDPYLKNIVINNKRFGVKSIKNFKKADIIIIAVKHSQYLSLSNNFFVKNIKSKGLIFDVKMAFLKLKNIKSKNFKYLSL